MKHGIVSRISQGAFRYQAWPTVARGDDGTLYVVSSGHRLNHVCPFGKNLMTISNDEGESWSSPIIVNDTYLDDRDAGVLVWDNHILLSWFNHPTSFYDKDWKKPHYITNTPLAMGMRELWRTLSQEDKAYGSFTKLSCDGGKTWSEPRKCPVSAPHGPIRKKDGSLLYLGRMFHTGDEWTDTIHAFESRDNGQSWTKLATIPFAKGYEKNFHEPHVCELADGTLIGGIRAHKEDYPGYLQIFTLFSYDSGKTWTEPRLLEGLHGSPPHFLLHSSGALILTYSQRRIHPQGQYARISMDGGKSWGKDFMISPQAPDWDHGYPSSVELTNGDILTVYYQKVPGDDYCSILSTRWKLPE